MSGMKPTVGKGILAKCSDVQHATLSPVRHGTLRVGEGWCSSDSSVSSPGCPSRI